MENRAGKRQREEKEKREDQKRKSPKKADADARKGREFAKHFFFPYDLRLRRVEKKAR